jgi:hypothetical protein
LDGKQYIRSLLHEIRTQTSKIHEYSYRKNMVTRMEIDLICKLYPTGISDIKTDLRCDRVSGLVEFPSFFCQKVITVFDTMMSPTQRTQPVADPRVDNS